MRNHRSYLSFVVTLFALFSLAAHGLVNTSPDSIENLKKINTVNLLMPLIYENLDSRTVQYMLRGYNGCYEWFSSQPGILGVQGFDGLENRCHPQALVSLGTNTPYNNIIWITAKDKETGDILKCESRVAKVHRIEIMTKLRTIDVGDVEILEVLGYDKEGNVFSTLEGMRFEWTIQTDQASNLELVSLKDSAIKTTALRKSLETSNFQTDIIVARGLKTGKATVSVRLKERDYGEVKASVVLHVIEHFIIYPDYEISVLPYARVNFNLALIKSDGNSRRLTPVALPSANYQWNNENKDLAVVNADGVVQCLNKPGAVTIKVRDLQTVDNTVEGRINIVTPYSIDIQIMEYSESAWEADRIQDVFERQNAKAQDTKFENVWNLIKDKEYYVRLSLYDETMKQIRITPNAKFNFEIDKTAFQIVEERNHEYRIKPIKLVPGNRVSASLDSIASTQGTYKPATAIRASREYRILSKISIIKPSQFVHLPILGGEVKSTKSQQTFKLHALGGSGRYEWVTRDLNIATISREAVILPKNVGRTVIEVRDVLNNRNLDEIEVVVSEITELAFLEEFKEIVSNNTGFVNVYAKGGSNHQHYSNCSFLSVNSLISNPSIATQVDEDQSYEDYLDYLNQLYTTNTNYKKLIGNHYSQEDNLKLSTYETHIKNGDVKEAEILRIFELYRNYGLCSRVVFQGEFKGETYIRATLGEASNRRITSHKELRLRVYDSFRTRDPVLSYKSDQPQEVILAYGSSFVWELEDGPLKWDDSRRLNVDLQPIHLSNDQKEVLETKTIEGSKSKRNFLIQCKTILSPDQKPANFNLKLAAWNDADQKLPTPVRLETEIRVSCRHPSSIEIYILREGENFLDVNTVQSAIGETFTIRHNEPYEFQTWVFDENKRPFYNFSSVRIGWTLNPAKSGNILPSKSAGRVHPLAEDQYTRLILTSTDGEATLKATIESPAAKPAISDEVSITIKNDIHLEPSQYVLFNHPENSFDIQVTKGSGEFGISTNDSSVVKFDYNRATQTIKVTPLKAGYAEISVEDRRLVNSKKAVCSIIVATPSKIQLDTESNVVEEGHSSLLTVTLFEPTGKAFRTQELRLMDISLALDSDSEYLKNYAVRITPHGFEGNQFNVEGRLRGDHRFVASAVLPAGVIGKEPRRIQSNPVEIHVFPKLATRPEKLVLSPGCFASLEIVGGPSEKAKAANYLDLVYSLDNTKSISINQQDDHLFIAEGLDKGTNKITFTLKNRDGQLISTLEVPVKIADVDKVEILGMVDRKIHVGAQARLIAVAKIGDEIFKPSLCPFHLQWHSKNENILKIQTPSATASSAHTQNKEKRGDFNIAINATALSVGVAEIELRLSGNDRVERSTTVKIRVIEPLSVDVPTYVGSPNYAGAPTWDANSVCKAIPPAHPALLLLPPHIEYQISPNNADDRNLRYSISAPAASASKVALSETGLLTTQGEKGRVTVLVEDTEVDSELLMVNVLITNIYSILVENSYGVLTLPTDADSHLKIHLQDTLGRAFPPPNELNKLSLGLSISDHRILEGSLVEKNSILYLRAKSEGLALVTVYLTENPSVFDIFYVNVGSVITPTQSPVYVHRGGNVNFLVASSPVGSSTGNRWSSEDSSIVDINPSTGRAVAKNAGKTHIHFSDTIEYASRVEVLQANKFVLDRSDLTFSNIPSSRDHAKEYEIPFRVFSGDQEIKFLSGEKDSVSNNLNFDCTVTPSGWFIASPRVEDQGFKQVPTCVLRHPAKYPHGATPSVITVRPTLTSNSKDVQFSYTQAFTFPFQSTFSVTKPANKQVTLNKDNNFYSIQVQAPNRLEASSDVFGPYITSSSYDTANAVHTVNINIPASERGPLRGTIELEDLRSGHKESVNVFFDQNAAVKREGASFNFVDYFLLAIIAVVILALVYSMKINKGPATVDPRQQQQQFRQTPSGPMGQYYSGYPARGEGFSTGRGFGFGNLSSETPSRSANQSNISDRDPYLRTSFR